jgi:hypothetical protein
MSNHTMVAFPGAPCCGLSGGCGCQRLCCACNRCARVDHTVARAPDKQIAIERESWARSAPAHPAHSWPLGLYDVLGVSLGLSCVRWPPYGLGRISQTIR